MAQRLEALDRAGDPLRRRRPLHARDVALGPGDVRAHRARRLAARVGGLGRRELPLRPRAQRQLQLLRTLGQRYGFRAEKIDPVRYKDFVVSSTRIRRLVAEGRMDEAGALLGHPYRSTGRSSKGSSAAASSGFPTANLQTDNELIPPHGVYATTLTIDGVVHAARHQHRREPDVRRPRSATTIETHVLDYDGDLYGRRVRLGFVQRLRDERRFDDVDALRRRSRRTAAGRERLFTRLSV